MAKKTFPQKILALLREHKSSLTMREIADAVGASISTVRRICAEFDERGIGDLVFVSSMERAFRLKGQPMSPHHEIISDEVATTLKLFNSTLRDIPADRAPLKTTRTLTKHGTTLVRFGMDHKSAHDAQRHRVSLYQNTSSLEN